MRIIQYARSVSLIRLRWPATRVTQALEPRAAAPSQVDSSRRWSYDGGGDLAGLGFWQLAEQGAGAIGICDHWKWGVRAWQMAPQLQIAQQRQIAP
jgi:hypothetical protein